LESPNREVYQNGKFLEESFPDWAIRQGKKKGDLRINGPADLLIYHTARHHRKPMTTTISSSYNKFLVRPDASNHGTADIGRLRRPLRSLCSIQDPSVLDLAFPAITDFIATALDSGPSFGSKSAVIAVIGDFREINSVTKKAWTW